MFSNCFSIVFSSRQIASDFSVTRNLLVQPRSHVNHLVNVLPL